MLMLHDHIILHMSNKSDATTVSTSNKVTWNVLDATTMSLINDSISVELIYKIIFPDLISKKASDMLKNTFQDIKPLNS